MVTNQDLESIDIIQQNVTNCGSQYPILVILSIN
jgi:hypothetical protein